MMKVIFLTTAAFIALVISLPIAAQPTEFELILLPVAPDVRVVHGAFGSQWVTTLAVVNIGETPVLVTRSTGNIVIPGAFVPLPPGMTEIVEDLNATSDAVRGAFAIVEQGRANDVSFTLRTSDLSRQHQTWGTTIPVVRQHELFSRTFTLLDIPAEAQFRSTLRIYDVDAATPPAVRVRVYGFYPSSTRAPDTLLAELTPAFAMPRSSVFPASAEIVLDFPALPGQRVRVEIEPLDGRQEYWGMVSVTHNETQHVTVISPE